MLGIAGTHALDHDDVFARCVKPAFREALLQFRLGEDISVFAIEVFLGFRRLRPGGHHDGPAGDFPFPATLPVFSRRRSP